jgi:hypothetical protein
MHIRKGWWSFGREDDHDYYTPGILDHEWNLTHLTRHATMTGGAPGYPDFDVTRYCDRITGNYTGDDDPYWVDPAYITSYEYNADLSQQTAHGMKFGYPFTYTVNYSNHYTDAMLIDDMDALWDATGWSTIAPGWLKQWVYDGSGAPVVWFYQDLAEWGLPYTSDFQLLYSSITELGRYYAIRVEHRSVAMIRFCVRENETGDLPFSAPSQAYSYRSTFDLPVTNDVTCCLYETDVAGRDYSDAGDPITCVPAEVTIEAPDWNTDSPYVRTRIPVYGGTCPAP